MRKVSKSLVSKSPFVLLFCSFLLVSVFSSSVMAKDIGKEQLRKTGKAFASIAKKVSPAVVFIKIEKNMAQPSGMQFFSPFGDDFLRQFFGNQRFREHQPRQRKVIGQGSGFIVSKNGYILTNNHVVGDTDKVTVRLQDGREFTAKIVGTDPRSDVAVIKIKAKNLPVLPLGDSDALEVGEWVIAVGNPFGLSHTLTAGIVSAKGRNSLGIADYENFIQTDAAINPGNSGGPLVNLDGKAVGMNTAIFSESGGYMGIGFAIPINMAKSIMKQLIKTGSVTRGYLGIIIQKLSPELAKSFGIENRKGILVSQVTKDSPADKAGLKRGDIIIGFNGIPVEKIGVFRNKVAIESPGTRDTVEILRDNKKLSLSIVIGTLPDKDNEKPGAPHSMEEIGLTVQTLTRNLAEKYNYQGEKGVVVTNVTPGSPAEEASIRPGSLISEVNRKPIENVSQFQHAIDSTSKQGSLLLLVKDGKYSRYIVIELKD